MSRGAGLARALVVTFVASLALAACQVLNRTGSEGDAVGRGRIAWPKDGDLWVYDLDARQQQRITNLPSGAAVTGASWSPDGKRIVYSQFWRRPNERASGADLFVANADGSSPTIFAERDTANGVLEAPQWAASGRVYYSVRHTAAGRETLAIARQAEGGPPETLVDGGYNPSISSDESTLIYLKNTRAGQTMNKKVLGQSGPSCELLSDQVFQYLSQPRISPDGAKVALAGSGEPNGQPSDCGGENRPAAKQNGPGLLVDLARLLEPSVAWAHGLPADVYTLSLDAGNLARAADIKDDDPTVAWSPDGDHLAIFGISALYVADVRTGTRIKLVDQGGYGGLSWAR